MACATYSRRKSGMRRSSRTPMLGAAGTSVIGVLLGVGVTAGGGHGVEREDDAERAPRGVIGGAVVELLEERDEALAKLRRAVRGQLGEAAGQEEGSFLGRSGIRADEAQAERQLHLGARGVEHGEQGGVEG